MQQSVLMWCTIASWPLCQRIAGCTVRVAGTCATCESQRRSFALVVAERGEGAPVGVVPLAVEPAVLDDVLKREIHQAAAAAQVVRFVAVDQLLQVQRAWF